MDGYSISAQFRVIDLKLFAFGMAIIILMNFMRSYRSWVLLIGMGTTVTFWKLFRWTQEAWFISVFTPGKVGEFYKAFRIEREFKTVGSGTLIVILERLLDLIIILMLGASAISINISVEMEQIRDVTIVVLLSVLLISTLLLKSKRFQNIIRKILYLLPSIRIRELVTQYLVRMREVYDGISLVHSVAFVAVTALIWGITICGYYLLLYSAKIEMPVLLFLSCFSLAVLVQSLPITLLGFGTRDVALIAFLSLYGVASHDSLTISLLFGVASIIALFVPALFWFSRSRILP